MYVERNNALPWHKTQLQNQRHKNRFNTQTRRFSTTDTTTAAVEEHPPPAFHISYNSLIVIVQQPQSFTQFLRGFLADVRAGPHHKAVGAVCRA